MIGRVIIKLAGKEAGRYGVIVDQVNDNYVIVDGNFKRRKCNLKHLELTDLILNLKKGASTAEVQEAMKKAKIKVTSPRSKKVKEDKTNGKRNK
jgi:large subunit ribosomal protein L14e